MRILNILPPCLVALAFLLATAISSRADIYRWDNGQLIPGTEGITPGPGVQLDHFVLEFASLMDLNLSNTSFRSSNLNTAGLSRSNLTNADLSDAVVTGAGFEVTTRRGFTKEQLYSTASYQAKNLAGIVLGSNDLTGWDFTGQNLANASLSTAILTNASLSGAVVVGANFSRSSEANGITKEQLYSTSSYQEKNLEGVGLSGYDLNGWDFSGQVVTGAQFSSTNLTKEQLYSTASYAARDLAGIHLAGSTDLSGWDFSGQDLTNAVLTNAKLTNAKLAGAMITGANFRNSSNTGISQEQLYSTASYQQKNLARISLERNDLTGWDFHGQNLTNASFNASKLTNANLSGANLVNGIFTPAYLTNADLSAADARGAVDQSGQPLDLTGANSFNTIRPDGIIVGLNLAAGDQLDVRNYLGDSRRGLGPIPIVVHDALNMEDGGALKMLFDAESWNSTISFQSGILVSLGGSLELAFADSVDAAEQAGRTFDLFDWTGVSPTGAFTVESDYLWDLSQLYSSGEVTLLPAFTGDTNGDGVVDIEDLNNVRNHFGGAGLGDTNGDGAIDLVDLNNVRNNFGAGGPTPVPEPTALILALPTIVIAMVLRGRNCLRPLLGFAVLLASCQPASVADAQSLDWVRQFGSGQYDRSWDVSADGMGNVYVSGNAYGNLDGPDPLVGSLFLRKYDSSGDVIWAKQFGYSPDDLSWGVSADRLGNVFVAGSVEDRLGFRDIFVSKFDASGSEIWMQQLGTDSNEAAQDVVADGLGGVYIAGATSGDLSGPNGSPSDAFLARYNSDGSLYWVTQTHVQFYDGANELAVDGSGNAYIAGNSQGDLGGAQLGNGDAFVSKYNANGVHTWTRRIGTSGSDSFTGLSADALGNVYASGGTAGALVGENHGGLDAILSKFDTEGELQWSRQWGTSGHDSGSAVTLDELGHVYVGGRSLNGADELFLNKFDAYGTLLSTRQFGTTANEGLMGLSADGLGHVFLAGFTYGELGGVNAGDADAFLAGLSVDDVVTPGDTNGDGLVDLADLNNVRNHFGGAGLGDTNQDGVINIVDLNAVRNNFGAGEGAPSVPEPSAALLLSFGGLAMFGSLITRWVTRRMAASAG